MSIENTEGHWGTVAKGFHWTIALLVFTQIPLGIYAANQREAMIAALDMSQIERIVAIFNLHKSIGLTIGLLVLFRMIWRLTHYVPPLSGEMPSLLRALARGTHWALYVTILTLVASGLVVNEAARIPLDFYYLFEIPNFFYVGDEMRDIAEAVHLVAVVSLSSLVTLHVAASAVHHFLIKDDTMVKMLPALLGGRSGPARPTGE